VRNRATQSVLLVAGAAAGAAAATWVSRRRLSAIDTSAAELIEPESAELPVGRSADPAIDDALERTQLPQDDTSGGLLLGDHEPYSQTGAAQASVDMPLDEVWNALPGFAEDEQTEGYDAVTPEDLGTVWLERATQTTHDARPRASSPSDVPQLEDLLVSESTLLSSHLDDDEADEAEEADEADERGHVAHRGSPKQPRG